MSRFVDIFPAAKAIIGVVHLPPLPGFDGHPGIPALLAHALADLDVLAGESVDGILVENEYDRPHRVTASPEVIAAMTQITRKVVSAGRSIVTGCEILLNDPRASLQVAAASGARFIRSDYFVDRMSRPGYGEFHIDPEGLVRHRNRTAAGVLILADKNCGLATGQNRWPPVRPLTFRQRGEGDRLTTGGRHTNQACLYIRGEDDRVIRTPAAAAQFDGRCDLHRSATRQVHLHELPVGKERHPFSVRREEVTPRSVSARQWTALKIIEGAREEPALAVHGRAVNQRSAIGRQDRERTVEVAVDDQFFALAESDVEPHP